MTPKAGTVAPSSAWLMTAAVVTAAMSCSVCLGDVTTTGSVLDNGTNVYVGYAADGTLTVSAGEVFARASSFIGWKGHTGAATVTGAGSCWTSDEVNVGNAGSGSLNIQAGATVSTMLGEIGANIGVTGNVILTSAGSLWILTDELDVGDYGGGNLGVEAGSQVASPEVYIGTMHGATGTVTVSGTGSIITTQQASAGAVVVGSAGVGTLNIQAGGQVNDEIGVIGETWNSSGVATVTGPNSTWANRGTLYVGEGGAGQLTVADNGTVTASSLSIDSTSVVRLHITGNGMMMVNSGGYTNNGEIGFYADSFLPAGAYTPICASDGSAASGSGSTGWYNSVGGTWNTTSRTFTVPAVTALSGGTVATVGSGQRLLFLDTASGRHLGASFGTISGGPTFSAVVASPDEVAALSGISSVQGIVLSAWDLSGSLGSGNEVLLSFDVGLGTEC